MINIERFSVNNFYDNININISNGKIVGLVGDNGSGKSLLTKYIMGIFNNYTGIIKINDEVLTDDNYSMLIKDLSVLLQNPYSQFIGETVMDELTFKLEQVGLKKDQIIKTIETLGYNEEFLNKKLLSLSGGEAQMLLLNSNLTLGENNLILDETLSNIDAINKEKIINQLRSSKKTVLFITNNINDTYFCDEVYLLSDKKTTLIEPVYDISINHINTKDQVLVRACDCEFLNFDITKGFNVVTGPTGCGKSTLFKSLVGLNAKNKVLNEASYIFQFPIDQISSIFVKEELNLFSKDDDKIKKYLIEFKLELSILEKNLNALSTGELTKVIVICCLLKESKIIIFDEALEVLDRNIQHSLLYQLKQIDNLTCIFITHNQYIYNDYEYHLIEM